MPEPCRHCRWDGPAASHGRATLDRIQRYALRKDGFVVRRAGMVRVDPISGQVASCVTGPGARARVAEIVAKHRRGAVADS